MYERVSSFKRAYRRYYGFAKNVLTVAINSRSMTFVECLEDRCLCRLGVVIFMAELVWKGKTGAEGQRYTPLPVNSHLQTIASYTPQEVNETLTDSSSSAPEWHNRLLFGDNGELLPLLLKEFAAKVNLIYIDPPFMTGRNFSSGTQVAYRDTWGNDIDTYLQWLYEILSSLYLLLAENGSIYVHLDWRTTHYVKLLLDEIFKASHKKGGGFRNEIIWHYQSGGRPHKSYARKHDTLLLYTKSEHACFHSERIGERRGTQKRNNMRKEVGVDGHISWTIRSAGRLYSYSEDSLITPSDVWSDIPHLHQRDPERTGYATQKPEALLERIIAASSEEYDLVLDCFCGSGVTPVIAEKLHRRWIACDKSDVAIATTQNRLLASTRFLPFLIQQAVS